MDHPRGAQRDVCKLGLSAAEAGGAQRRPRVQGSVVHFGCRPPAVLHVLHGAQRCGWRAAAAAVGRGRTERGVTCEQQRRRARPHVPLCWLAPHLIGNVCVVPGANGQAWGVHLALAERLAANGLPGSIHKARHGCRAAVGLILLDRTGVRRGWASLTLRRMAGGSCLAGALQTPILHITTSSFRHAGQAPPLLTCLECKIRSAGRVQHQAGGHRSACTQPRRGAHDTA